MVNRENTSQPPDNGKNGQNGRQKIMISQSGLRALVNRQLSAREHSFGHTVLRRNGDAPQNHE